MTQLSVDRLDRLSVMATTYKGPISAAIYIRNKDKDLLTLQSLREENQHVRNHVDFHVLFDDYVRHYLYERSEVL
jgi:hypothetical protein